MIQINDMFRLATVSNYWRDSLRWVLQEWQPTPDSTQGRWKTITKSMDPQQMDRLLERMDCPKAAHERFRAQL